MSSDGPGEADRSGRGTSDGNPLTVLRHGRFAQLLGGNFISSMGVWLHTAAAAWVMLELTGSPLMVGLVTGATFIPRLVLGIPAGALIDVFDRRGMVLIGNVSQGAVAVATGLLYAQGLLGPWLLFGMTLLLGAGQALAMPAYHAVIQDVVPRLEIASAVTLHSGSVNVARAIGPAVGGALIAAGRTELAFLLNGASYLAICIPAYLIPRRGTPVSAPESVRGAMRTGVRFVRHSPLLLRLLLVSGLFALTSANLQALLAPAAAHRGLGAEGYGLLFSCFGVGALAGALVTGRVCRALGTRPPQPTSILSFGLSGLAFAIIPSTPVAAVAVACAGAAWVITFATLNSTVQLAAPAWVRGRILSIYMMAFTGALPLGAAIAGAVAERIGTPPAIALLSVSVMAVAGLTSRIGLPAVGDVEAPTAPEDWDTPVHPKRVTGGPVAVLVTWEIEPESLQPFLDAMSTLRRFRHRSGAVRWTLFRHPDRPERMTELFEVHDWDEHLRQHQRLDREAAAAIAHARSFDRTGAPVVRHLVGIDLRDPSARPGWEDLLAVHELQHERDGSLPLSAASELRSSADA